MPRKDPRLASSEEFLNEKIQDRVIRHMLYLEGLKTREAREIIRILDRETIPNIRKELAERLAKIEAFGFDRGPETTRRLEKMLKEFLLVSKGFNKIRKTTEKVAVDLGNDEAVFIRGMINEESPVNISLGGVSPDIIKRTVLIQPFDGRNMEQWYNNLADAAKNRLDAEIRRGVIEGQTTAQIVRRLNPVLEVTRRQTEAVTRTALQHAANSARNEFYKANSDVLEGVKWVSTLDSRTSSICQSLDSKTFPLDKGPRPPAHVNCRSSVTPVTKSWRALGFDADDLPASTRASMNGQVPGDVTYSEWLRKQPVAVQEDALGKTKAKLFRKGGLEIDRFTNRNLKELTLKELRQRESGAFEKAGLQ